VTTTDWASCAPNQNAETRVPETKPGARQLGRQDDPAGSRAPACRSHQVNAASAAAAIATRPATAAGRRPARTKGSSSASVARVSKQRQAGDVDPDGVALRSTGLRLSARRAAGHGPRGPSACGWFGPDRWRRTGAAWQMAGTEHERPGGERGAQRHDRAPAQAGRQHGHEQPGDQWAREPRNSRATTL